MFFCWWWFFSVFRSFGDKHRHHHYFWTIFELDVGILVKWMCNAIRTTQANLLIPNNTAINYFTNAENKWLWPVHVYDADDDHGHQTVVWLLQMMFNEYAFGLIKKWSEKETARYEKRSCVWFLRICSSLHWLKDNYTFSLWHRICLYNALLRFFSVNVLCECFDGLVVVVVVYSHAIFRILRTTHFTSL